MYTGQAEGMGTFAGDAALWAAAGVGSDDPGHEMFGAADPLMYLRYVASGVSHLPHQRRPYHRKSLSSSRARDQDVYDATSQVAGLHGDPCAAAGEAEAEAEAWRQAYTCTELLSTLIPATPFPLMPVSHRAGASSFAASPRPAATPEVMTPD